MSLRFTKPLPVEVADKWGSNHPDDVFVQVIPPDQISQAQREAFLDCVRAAAAACGTSCACASVAYAAKSTMLMGSLSCSLAPFGVLCAKSPPFVGLSSLSLLCAALPLVPCE